MPSIAVVSSVYGEYDAPKAQPHQDGIDDIEWIMVSDSPDAPPPWRVVVEPRHQLHPRLAAKVAKCRPDLYSDADILVWIDGNIAIDSPTFISWVVSTLDGGVLAQHESIGRSSLIGESHIAVAMPKYAGLPVIEQAHSYVDDGYPDQWGLWWTGLMVRTRDCPDFGTPWLAEMVRWTYEDQISQAPTLRTFGLRPNNIPIQWPPTAFHLCSHRDTS